MEILQALGRPVQLFLSHLGKGIGGNAKSHTSSSLLTWLFLIYCITFPCAIHSEIVMNSPLFMSP